MPAKDFYHDTVVRALTKSGWMVSQEQVHLDVGKRHLWIDLFTIRFTDNTPMLIEIKGFENISSQVDYLSAAAGQYGLYKGILEERKNTIPLYMAIPVSAFNGIFKEKIGRIAIKYFDIRLAVFDPDREEIVRWSP